MNKIVLEPKIEYPEYKELLNVPFDNYYETIIEYEYNPANPDPIIINSDRGNKEMCVCCGKTKTDGITFKNKAHIIPAFFQNPRIYTDAECDECNHYFGKEYENHLAKMLGKYIFAANVFPRKGKEKKFKSKEITATYHKEDGINIETRISEDNVKIDLEQGKLSFSLPLESYNPQKALRSILHTFWLVIDDNTRKEQSWVIEKLFNQNETIPSKINLTFNPTFTDKIIKLKIHKLREKQELLCNYILTLQFNSASLSYGIDQDSTKLIIPQPIIIHTTNSSIPSSRIIDFGVKNIVKPQKVDLHYNFSLAVDENGIEYSTNLFTQHFVALSIKKNNQIISFEGTPLITYNQENITIGGGGFTAELIFTKDKNSSLVLKLENQLITEIKQTIDFLKVSNDGELIIQSVAIPGEKLSLPFKSDTKSLDDLFPILNAIYNLSINFQRDIKYYPPTKQDIFYINLLLELNNLKESCSYKFIFTEEMEYMKTLKKSIQMRTDGFVPFPDCNFKVLKSTYNWKDLFTFELNEDSEIEINSDDKYIELQNVKIVNLCTNKTLVN